MRKLIILASIFFYASSLAQTPKELYDDDPMYANELYRPYPVEYIGTLTPAPKGYKPVYISHLGRHGSRWSVSEKQYNDLNATLQTALQKGELTQIGERFCKDWAVVAKDAQDRYGELSRQGMVEHQGIAARMYKAYPELFNQKGCTVNCISTIVPRCIISMGCFAKTLQGFAPNATINIEASESNTFLKAYAGLNSIKQDAIPYSDSIRRANMPSLEPIFRRIFKKNSTVEASIEDKDYFIYDMYLANAVLQATPHVGIETLSYLFTEDERALIWKASNMRRYILGGPSVKYLDAVLGGIVPLTKVVVAQADKALEDGQVQASLRFAHDVTIVPFVKMFGIPCGDTTTDDLSDLAKTWRIHKISPMASNIQLIFYKNKKDDVLVKVLHCEREQKLVAEVGEPVEGVYYRWSDLRRFLINRIEKYEFR